MNLRFVSRWTAVLLCAIALPGCTELAYYGQATRGHWNIVRSAQPVDALIMAESTSPDLRARLRRSDELRRFAVTELRLPDNGSYRSYATLDRSYAVWSVFAAPELSLTPKTWCYPLLGCLSYRGYFDLSDAGALATELRAQGFEVWVGGVPAYSSLGWSDDPLLSTFIGWPDGRLAELVFHELAHQMLYVPGDTSFNEAFATTVGQRGAERWLASRDETAALADYRQHRQRRRAFLSLATAYRERLSTLYDSTSPDDAKRRGKAVLLAQFARDYEDWKASWGGYSGYDAVVALGPNNAWFSAMATYHEWVPAFEVWLDGYEGDFPRFYEKVKELASLPAADRQRRMKDVRRHAEAGGGAPP